MITIKIDEEELLEMLTNRVEHWTDDPIAIGLYEDMYENYVYGGVFDGAEVNIMYIVDNDWVNNCDVIGPDDDRYEAIDTCYKENGLGDCSCEDCEADFIEAEYDGYYLIRW